MITTPGSNAAFVVWMMESFFRGIPSELEEAAMVDGDSRLTAFRRIVLPRAALPNVVFALLVQRHLVRGLTMGAVK